MTDEQKRMIEETVENLKHLDRVSLMIVKSGAEMLRSRDYMERTECNDSKLAG